MPVSQGLEAGHPGGRDPARGGNSSSRRQSDPEPGEQSWPSVHGHPCQVRYRPPRLPAQPVDSRHQDLGVALAPHQHERRHGPAVVPQRAAHAGCGCFDGQDFDGLVRYWPWPSTAVAVSAVAVSAVAVSAVAVSAVAVSAVAVSAVAVLAVAALEERAPSVGSPLVEFWPAHAKDSSAKRPCQLGPKARNWSRRPWAGVGAELVRCSAVGGMSSGPGS